MPRKSADYVENYWENGFAIVRGFLDRAAVQEIQAETQRLYAAGLRHPYTYRDGNLLFEILPEDYAGQRYLLQAHWVAWISPLFERLRRSPRYFEVLAPLLGRNIKQVAQQIHWKPPGAPNNGYRLHQDLRFREQPDAFRALMSSYVTTGLAIDPATRENGCLRVLPGSHRRGYLGLSDDGPIMNGLTEDAELRRLGLDPAALVDLELEPGDLALWSLLTVHGSLPNRSPHDRAFLIAGYVTAANSERGEWAFRDGEPVPLGTTPAICKYEALRERPGPFYVDERWFR